VAESRQLCTFVVDGLLLGIDVRQVQEVFRSQEMTAVPLADPSVAGLLNLRGQIVTAIDLRTRLGLGPRPDGIDPMHVVIRTDDGAVSLLVDEIGDVIESGDDVLERPPETLVGGVRRMIQGVYKLAGRLLLVLDTETALTFDVVRG